ASSSSAGTGTSSSRSWRRWRLWPGRSRTRPRSSPRFLGRTTSVIASRFRGRQHGNRGRMAEVVVITGGSAGVGRAVAQRFARRGCSIGVIARGQERLDASVIEIDKMGGRGLALPCDVADPVAVEAAADRAETELGPIDIWINNA